MYFLCARRARRTAEGRGERWRTVRGNSVPPPVEGRGTAGALGRRAHIQHSKRRGVAEKEGGPSQDGVGILHPHPLRTFPGMLAGADGREDGRTRA